MTLDYSHVSEVHISMVKYITDVWDTFQKAQAKLDNGFVKVRCRSKSQMTAAPLNLFAVNEECKPLSNSQQEIYHFCVAKALYFTKRARPDILPSISFLTKQVKKPDKDDWEKLAHMIKYLNSMEMFPLILSADDGDNLYWYADSAFGVHADMKSHNGAGLTLGRDSQ